MKLQYVITIEDEESVENYKDVHAELVLEDIVHGSLGERCSISEVPTARFTEDKGE